MRFGLPNSVWGCETCQAKNAETNPSCWRCMSARPSEIAAVAAQKAQKCTVTRTLTLGEWLQANYERLLRDEDVFPAH